MGIITWAILGLIAGAIAKAIYPGQQNTGLLGTMALGIVGSFVGGWIGEQLREPLNDILDIPAPEAGSFSLSGIIMAVLGAIAIIFLWGLLTKPSR
ncbi:MAG: GlsB/YeaQ/YmgE family stress response membrane protein [Cyanobacteria bacterium SW_9_44_58]|nr:MAG: GlsB/YeaQ/YmgE family stress response membrane protein [Cyanobacteria bacterium SW_9_44_58]